MAISWRVAESLQTLLRQINELYPNRSTASDGSIGDDAHASRDSDHNPWIEDPPGPNVVSARDFTHDPANGLDCNDLAKRLELSRDPRIKYVIWNRRMLRSYAHQQYAAWTWAPYSGTNPHTKHLHISVSSWKVLYDADYAWAIAPYDTTISALAVNWGVKGVPLSGRYETDAQQFMSFAQAIGAIPAYTQTAYLTDPSRYNLLWYALIRVQQVAGLLVTEKLDAATADYMRRRGAWTVTDVNSTTAPPASRYPAVG